MTNDNPYKKNQSNNPVALPYGSHPATYTRSFHQAFNAPIAPPNALKNDPEFSYMDDQRLAFRLSFIFSEAIEILEQGLGLNVEMSFSNSEGSSVFSAPGSSNQGLCLAIQRAIASGPRKRDVVKIYDGLGDLNVVVNGFSVELGGDIMAVDAAIFDSNMSKLDDEGKPIVADGSDPKYPAGKIIKGPNFFEPDIEKILFG